MLFWIYIVRGDWIIKWGEVIDKGYNADYIGSIDN